MNPLDWRNLWDLAMIERTQRDEQLEQRRRLLEAGILPGGKVASAFRVTGGILIAAGQRLVGEPVRSPLEAAHTA